MDTKNSKSKTAVGISVLLSRSSLTSVWYSSSDLRKIWEWWENEAVKKLRRSRASFVMSVLSAADMPWGDKGRPQLFMVWQVISLKGLSGTAPFMVRNVNKTIAGDRREVGCSGEHPQSQRPHTPRPSGTGTDRENEKIKTKGQLACRSYVGLEGE